MAPPPANARATDTKGYGGSAVVARSGATARALLEYEVGAVALSARGAGYGASQDLDLRFFPRRQATAAGARGPAAGGAAANRTRASSPQGEPGLKKPTEVRSRSHRPLPPPPPTPHTWRSAARQARAFL